MEDTWRKQHLAETCGDFDWTKKPHWANADKVCIHLGIDAARSLEELQHLYPPDALMIG